jgi:hypothetical protein
VGDATVAMESIFSFLALISHSRSTVLFPFWISPSLILSPLTHINNMERLLNDNHDGIDIPARIVVDLILPFVDRETWNNLILTNREIYKASKKIELP